MELNVTRTALVPPSPRKVYTDLAVLEITHVRQKTWTVDLDIQDEFLAFVTAGAGHLSVERRPPQTIGPGSLFMTIPGTHTRHGPYDGGTWDEFFIRLSGPGTARWKKLGLVPADHRAIAHGRVDLLAAGFAAFQALIESGRPEVGDLAVAELERLLVEMRYARIEAGSDASRRDLDDVLQYVNQHLAEPLKPTEVARQMGISYSHLRRRFRALTGTSLRSYIAHRRCDLACQLLVSSDLPIAEIARRVGLPQPARFARTFARCVGMSARRYRHERAPWAGGAVRAQDRN